MSDAGGKIVVETDPGFIFSLFNRRDPRKSRERLGTLYWQGWTRLVMSFFLLSFGILFLVIGVCCMCLCTDFDRGVAFFFVGVLLALPGGFSAVILLNYLRCVPGYSFEQLPDYN